MDPELKQMLDDIPDKTDCFQSPKGPPNAHVYLDIMGRVCIEPITGGWLGASITAFSADLAPYSD